MIRIRIPSVLLVMIVLTGCTSDQNSSTSTNELEVINLKQQEYEMIATNLQEPWEVAMVGEKLYISERKGAIVEIEDGQFTRKRVQFKKDLSNQPEAGLLGISFPPSYTNKAYAYYSYVEGDKFFQRVVEITQVNDTWKETATLLDQIPGGKFHQGGRIEIGPDQRLYITTGDATVPELSQDLNSLAGKILRMNLNGSIPDDNPFENSYVYSYGHRNPQGLAWDEEGQLYATEHGSSAHDEINHIQKGRNYGWPIIQGDERREGMETPVVHSGETTWAPSGMAYLDGKFYFASLRGEGVREFNPKTKNVHLIISDIGRVRDVLSTPKGLYAITNNTDGRGNPSNQDDVLLFIPLDTLKEISPSN
jgi:glucose/arabinose dehydrogenase